MTRYAREPGSLFDPLPEERFVDEVVFAKRASDGGASGMKHVCLVPIVETQGAYGGPTPQYDFMCGKPAACTLADGTPACLRHGEELAVEGEPVEWRRSR